VEWRGVCWRVVLVSFWLENLRKRKWKEKREEARKK